MNETTLDEYLKNHPQKGFRSVPQYFVDGDFVAYFLSNELADEERVDDLLTIYRSIDTGEIVGCKIKGIASLIEDLQVEGLKVTVEAKPVKIVLLIMRAMVETEPEHVSIYKDVYAKFKKSGAEVPLVA